MDIRQLRYFVAVAETLSFTRAARDLYISSSPLSRRITELEGELGVKLFDRDSKKVELTTAGKAFLPQARDVLRTFEAALRGGRSLSPSQSRHLRIGLPDDTSQSVPIGFVNSLRSKQVSVYLVEAPTAEQQRLLATGEIDIGVLRHPFDERGLWVSEPLGLPVGVVMASEHPLASLDTLHLADLSPYPLVSFPRHLGPGTYDEMLDLFRAGGYVPPKMLYVPGPTTAAVLLRTELAVSLWREREFKRLHEDESNAFLWKQFEGSQIHIRTSVVCRSNECVGLTRVAVDAIFAALQEHEHWVPMLAGDGSVAS